MSEFITHSREETVALGAQVAQHRRAVRGIHAAIRRRKSSRTADSLQCRLG